MRSRDIFGRFRLRLRLRLQAKPFRRLRLRLRLRPKCVGSGGSVSGCGCGSGSASLSSSHGSAMVRTDRWGLILPTWAAAPGGGGTPDGGTGPQGRRHRFWTGGAACPEKGPLAEGAREPTFYDVNYLLSCFNPRPTGGAISSPPPLSFSCNIF